MDFLRLKWLNRHAGTFSKWIDPCWPVSLFSFLSQCAVPLSTSPWRCNEIEWNVLTLKIHSTFFAKCVYLSNTMLQCRSNALTRPSSFLLLRQLINTCVLFLTDCVSTDSGPVLNSSSSWRANSSGVNSDFGLARALDSQWKLRLCVRAFDWKTFSKTDKN